MADNKVVSRAADASSTTPASAHDEAQLTINFKDKVDPDKHFAPVTISGHIGDNIYDQLAAAVHQKEAQHYSWYWDQDSDDLFFDIHDGVAVKSKNAVLTQAQRVFTITLGHHVKWVYHNKPTTEPGFTKDDLNHTYKQTINYIYPDSSKNKTVVNTLSIYRDVKVDEVTGKVSYDDWTYTGYKDKWPDITLPSGEVYLDPVGWNYYDPTYSPTQVRYENVGGWTLRGRKCDRKDITINVYIGHITYHLKDVNALTGETLSVPTKHRDDVTDGHGNYDVKFGMNLSDATIGHFQSSQLNGPFIASIPGYKFVEGDIAGTDIHGDYSVLKDQKIGSTDRTLVLKYAPLSLIEIQYVDQDRNQVLKTITMPTTDALPGTVGDAEKIGPYNYETHPLDDIPGYEYTGEHSANVDGFVGQTQTKDSENLIVVKYYYKEIPEQSKIAEYTRKSIEVPYLDDSWVPTLSERDDGDPIDYTGVDQGVKNHSKTTGFEFIGALNSKDGRYSGKTKTILTYVFTPRQKVTVNYINLVDGKKMKEANGDDSTVTLTPTAADGNNNWKWTSDQKSFTGYQFVSVDRSTSGKYGFLEQEVNYYYLPIVNQKTETKTVQRIVHFVADNDNHDQLQDSKTQQVKYTTTFYTDKDGNLVNAKAVKDASGKTVYVLDVDNKETSKKTWTVDDTQGASLKDGQASYDQVKQDQIDVASGALKGHWVIEKAAQDNVDGQPITTNDVPAEKISNDIADGTVENVYLIYDLTHSYDEQMTFTRQVKYQGTKDGGKTYEAVNGSPDAKSSYKQTIVFTRHVVKNSAGEVISTSAWAPQTSNELAAVVSKRPSQVSYEMVDVDQVDAEPINPNDYKYIDQPIDLGTKTVTYRTNVVQNNTVTRHIYYRDAATGEKIKDELAKQGIDADVPDITQTVSYTRLAVYDKDGHFLGYAQLETDQNGLAKKDANGQPIAKKDANGQPLIADEGANDGWVPFGLFTQYPAQGSPDLTKYGYKKAQSFDRQDNKGDAAEVAGHQSTPEHNGKNVNVYYFHDQEDVDGSHEGVDPNQLTKTFTRTVVYRGAAGDSQTYHDVKGSPDGTSRYVQKLTFTRKAIIDKVTQKVTGYTEWTSPSTSLTAVPSKAPQDVNFDTVDTDPVSARPINPDKDSTDLGTVVVTYGSNVAEHKPVVRHIYYRDAVTGEKITDELAKHGIEADVPDITQTVDYTRLAVYNPSGVFLGYAQLETTPEGLAQLVDGELVAKKGTDGQPLIAGKGANDGWVPFGVFTKYPAQGSPDLTKYGYKKAQSFEQAKNKGDAAEVASHQSTPEHNGKDVNVYYFHDQEEVDGNQPGVDADQLTKTFTRTVVYRGTRDHGQSYQDVNGSPTGTHRYVQTLTFTRKAIIDSVTHQLLGYTDWTADHSSFAAVDSQTPAAVGYQTVDRTEFAALAVDPDSDQTDLGTVVVTYQAEPQPVAGQPGTKQPGTNQPGSSTGEGSEATMPTAQQPAGEKQSQKTPDSQKLPQTGNDRSAALAGLGLFGLLMGLGLGKKKQD